MTNSDFTVYSKAQYYSDLVARVSKTGKGDSIAVATMNFEPREEGVQVVVNALTAAAKRGADVRLTIDAYNFLVSKNKLLGPMWFSEKLPAHLPAYYRKKLTALERLKAAGGHYTITNMPVRPFKLPFGGRSHIKYAIVNDYVYVGGCNLSSMLAIDVMVGWQDKTTAAWLYNFANEVDQFGSPLQALSSKDIHRQVDEQTELLVDAGIPNRSLIYEEALNFIDQAEESVYITCQFFPNSRTTHHLVRAHKRGVNVTVIFNHPIKHKTHYMLQQAVVWRERVRAPAVFFTNQLPRSYGYLHAKLIATEKGAIIGSHNYVRAGVAFGTAEIALLRRDPDFAFAAIRAIKEQIT